MSTENKGEKMDIKISLATPEDVRGMAEVFHKTWLATFPNEKAGITTDDIEDRFKDSFTEEALKKRAEKISQLKENETSILAKIGEKIIGVCYVVKHPDKNELQAIYVLPEHQKKGVGKSLWEQAQKHFDINKDTVVEVATYNAKTMIKAKKSGIMYNQEKYLYGKTIYRRKSHSAPQKSIYF